MNRKQFPQIVTQKFKFLRAAQQTSYECHHTLFCCSQVFEHGKNVCYFYYVQCSLNTQIFNSKKFPPQVLMYQNSFVRPCIQSFCPIFMQSFKQHLYMIQIYDSKFDVYNLFFNFVDKRYTHTHTYTQRHIHTDQTLKI